MIAVATLGTVALFGSTLGLARRPAASIAASVTLIAFSLLFTFVYPGGYRHASLWLAFLVSLYWICGQKSIIAREDADNVFLKSRRNRRVLLRVERVGIFAFILLLLLQVRFAAITVAQLVINGAPESRSRDAAQVIKSTPILQDAVIVADPDYLIEPFPYYIANRLYLLRERRFGDTVVFTKRATRTLSLSDVLGKARELRTSTGRSIIILLSARLDPAAAPKVVKEGYDWELTTSPQSITEFLSSVELVKSFGPVSTSDETFDMYLLANELAHAEHSGSRAR